MGVCDDVSVFAMTLGVVVFIVVDNCDWIWDGVCSCVARHSLQNVSTLYGFDVIV